ncbi:hypothetical protein Enr13x_47020 [Stieleria neptunia]|uniref:Glycosyl transferases group 1 n=1 Tax=Stieleria neptunia TaxID=2527979 RepID=A0A518HVE6_9BACT|nr:hypothetical protein [Stieleria neptunia]QDV44831.1 hypothetical protein Enr13x_47020 [Stieleria neptunia]
MSASPPNSPRILFLDDNVRDIGGHYLELASLLADGARQLGYRPKLVTHASLPRRNPQLSGDSRLEHLDIEPRFDVRRMENWSLGVDGPSMVQRDCHAVPVGGSVICRIRQSVDDFLCRPSRRPRAMLNAWSSAFVDSVRRFAPQPNDRIVINTGGDFQILALAHAIETLDREGDLAPMTLHVLFHFAVFESTVTERAVAFGRQVNAAVAAITGHRIHLHATTESLCQQLAAVGVHATAIPYPTRAENRPSTSPPSPAGTKILLAGMPRAEKGRDQIRGLLESIEQPYLRSGRFSWSMQLPEKRWQRMIPLSLQPACPPSASDRAERDTGVGLEILRGNLTSAAYHGWLDTAGIGLFLYDAERYVARCSGVLLEMMIRGVPVMVPDGCWLADQVRAAEPTGSIGWIYQSVDQIPQLLSTAEATLADITANCRRHAKHIAAHHSGKNSLLEMGITDHASSSIRRAG